MSLSLWPSFQSLFCLIGVLQLLLSCLLAWNMFPYPLTFNLRVSFALRWVFCRHQIVGFCFYIQSATLCLLIGAFSPLTLKVIIDKYVFITTLNLVFQLNLCSSFVPFSFWLDDFHLFYACVIFSFCECNVWFWFVVAL